MILDGPEQLVRVVGGEYQVVGLEERDRVGQEYRPEAASNLSAFLWISFLLLCLRGRCRFGDFLLLIVIFCVMDGWIRECEGLRDFSMELVVTEINDEFENHCNRNFENLWICILQIRCDR